MDYHLFWGDLHNHNNVGLFHYSKGSLERSIEIAKSHLDFFAFTGHAHWHDMPEMPGQGHLKWREGFDRHTELWPKTKNLIAEADTDGEFVAFLGYEWHSAAFGDRAVLYPNDDGDLVLPDHIDDLTDHARSAGAILVPHHIGYRSGIPGRGINWDHVDESVSPIIEIYSEHGGPRAKPTPYNTPNRYGAEEIRHLSEAVQLGRLMYNTGGKVREFEDRVARTFGCKHVLMTTSGTAAIHIALAAAGVAERDEVITTPMSDVGAFTGILAQHAVPVFADIDLNTAGPSPESVESLITPRTKAVIVIHMAGIVSDMDAFLEIGRKHGVSIIEDCSQCHGGKWKGKFVGTLGTAGAFSMNESKHMSAGDGGFLTTDDDRLAEIAALFRDKAYLRSGVARGEQPIPFAAFNYRPTCLTGAMGLAQLDKLQANVARRAEIVRRYYDELGGLPHLLLPKLHEGAEPAWWPVPARYVGETPTRDELAAALRAEGLQISTGMAPANNTLRTELIRRKHFYPLTDRVPHFWRDTIYDPDSCPNVDEMARTVLRLPVDHRYTDEDITQTIQGFHKVWEHYFGRE